MWLSLSLSLLLGATTAIDDSLACPSADQVEAALDRISFPQPRVGARYTVQLRGDGQNLVLTLREASGRLIGHRALMPSGTCDAVATTVAVVVAAWEADLGSSDAPVFPTPPLETPPTPSPPQDPPPADAAGRPPPLHFGAAIGAGASDSAGGLALEGLVRGDVHRDWYGAELTLWAEGQRTLSLAGSSALWHRVGATVGLELTPVDQLWRLDVVPQVSVALLGLSTLGYRPMLSGRSVDLGLGGCVRASLGFGFLRPWLELSAVGWPLGGQVSEPQTQASLSLPVLELTASFGVAMETGP